MDREFKIVISIFSFFLIYGLSGWYTNGVFYSPIIFNQSIFFTVAALFWLMNIKQPQSWVLSLYVLVQLIACLIDPLIMNFLYVERAQEIAGKIYESTMVSWLFIISYFGFMLFASVFTFMKHRLTYVLVINMLLLVATIIFLGQPDLQAYAPFPFFAFLLFFFFTINRLMNNPKQIFHVLAHQFLLIFMLEGLEYLH